MATRNPGRTFAEFEQEQDLIAAHTDKQVNKFDIYCPQETCRCKLLLASAAALVQREKNKLVLPKLPLASATVSTIDEDATGSEQKESSSSQPTEQEKETKIAIASEELQSFWRVTDVMAFENIGVSKLLPNNIQFLSCADCDTGPLGYHDKSAGANKEYLIALNRVRYSSRA
ncbi:hypothetical protein EDD11_005792 [Mortierella claussenii]|nr:hypothetical protein EDD11_005792 [Mortierella claussenii]